MEWLIQSIALALALGLAAIKSLRMALGPLDTRAMQGTLVLKQVTLVALLAWLLVGTHPNWSGVLMLLCYLLLAEALSAQGWLNLRFLRPLVLRASQYLGFLRWLAPKDVPGFTISSKQEFMAVIKQSQGVLSAQEASRVMASLDLYQAQVSDLMVPRQQIKTVEVKETVGPLLLDRLHKEGHNVFVVVKKDLNDVRGLLYMRDIVTPHPDIQTVKDATRPHVPYVPQTATVGDFLQTSLRTGRQLFLVKNKQDEAVGLITLADVLSKLHLV